MLRLSSPLFKISEMYNIDSKLYKLINTEIIKIDKFRKKFLLRIFAKNPKVKIMKQIK